MCDVFTPLSALSALRGKSLLLIGDSIMRNIYKDIVYLLSSNEYKNKDEAMLIPTKHMMAKGEHSYRGDSKVKGTKEGAFTPARDYTEERDWHSKDSQYDVQVSFRFITRCHDEALERDLRAHPDRYGSFPDVILLNSALWDVNRWGPRGIQGFKDNLPKLMGLFNQILPERTQVIWMTTPPIATDIRSGIMIQQLEFQQKSMRFNIMEANQYAATVTAAYGYDVLDMHYHFINQIHRRSEDGVHWKPDAVRMQTNIILTHICLSSDVELPKNWKLGSELRETESNVPLENAKKMVETAKQDGARMARRVKRAKRRREKKTEEITID